MKAPVARAVHGLLHLRVKILDAQTDAVEADLGQVAQPLPGGGAPSLRSTTMMPGRNSNGMA